MKYRLAKLRRLSKKTGKSADSCCSSYGFVMENEAIDDEEFPPLPTEGDLKKIKIESVEEDDDLKKTMEEKADEEDDIEQEEDRHEDYPSLVQADSGEADKSSSNLAQ